MKTKLITEKLSGKMKKILTVIFILFTSVAYSQLNNSWIDYNKTYYKFYLANNSLCRISQATLSAKGLGNIPAEQFQLWRNGQQVRLYTSVATGPLGVNDYIDFWGTMNDGLADKPLYQNPDFQLNDSFSLTTDTAAYFLTVNPAGNNLRFSNETNTIPNNPPTPDAYFINRIEKAYKAEINRGYAETVGEAVYSSSYLEGEGWGSSSVAPGNEYALSYQFNNLNVYTNGPDKTLSVSVTANGNSIFTRHLVIKLQGQQIYDEEMNYYDIKRASINSLPLTYLLNADYANISVGATASDINARISVEKIAVSYPSKFNFNNQKEFYFELKASPLGNYLEIENFNTGGVAPVLFDFTSGKRYIGDISTAGKIKFMLPGSSESVRKFRLVNQETSNYRTITSLATKNFINYGNVTNQGNYIIITNPVLFDDGNGNNYVEQYRQYRASSPGGSFKAIIVSIDELNDQFGLGIKRHPSAIRDFVRYAVSQFSEKPQYLFIIGRGVAYLEAKFFEAYPDISKLDLVQTFGWPASDILLVSEPKLAYPLIPVGRLSVINGTEISHYLEKVKEYEQSEVSGSQIIADKAWMKNFVHVVGGANDSENKTFTAYLDYYKAIAEDTLYGAKVETFRKSTTASVEQATAQRIKDLFKEGIGVLSYFGHSSANILAFNLSDPSEYDNKGKYPFFNVSGCSAGNFFTYDPPRLNGNLTISENYVLAKEKGSIGFLASTHLGIPTFLHYYNTAIYNKLCRQMYGNTIGNQIKQAIKDLRGDVPVREGLDYFTRMHIEEITLHGDPALHIYNSPKPDYVIEDPLVKISPSAISVADAKFTAVVKMMNIGKAINDSIRITIKRKLPTGTIKTLVDSIIPATKYMDSIYLEIAIDPITDKGLNQLQIALDVNNEVAEMSETNNTLNKDFLIFEDELRPIYPYNYSIINQQNIVYSASTANPLLGNRQYLMEFDTTSLFSSPFKKQYNASGTGGLVQFSPGNTNFTDSTVYYWRVGIVPLNGGTPAIWNTFSFVYLANASSGFNQSHYYQHLNSIYSQDIYLDTDRSLKFKEKPRNLIIRTGLYPLYDYDEINIYIDTRQVAQYGCQYNSLQFMVYDSLTLEPWQNTTTNNSGRFGSFHKPGCPINQNYFEFPYYDPVYRKRAMDFLDSIPNGMYVSITNLGESTGLFAPGSFVQDWKKDTTTLGSGKSLYHKLVAAGFTEIDSFTRHLPFIYLYKKNSQEFIPQQIMGAYDTSYLTATFPLNSLHTEGTIESPAFGPAKKWNSLIWRGNTLDTKPGDFASIDVYGIKTNGDQVFLRTVLPAKDTSVSFIDAKVYPFVKLKMNNVDSLNFTPYQLKYWRLLADYTPEGAVAPGILYSMKDTVEQAENIDFSIVFKNISPVAFEKTMKVKFVITDKNNVPHVINIPERKVLVSGDTLIVKYSISTIDLPGLNTLYIMFNPDNDQTEQFVYNNILYKDFYVKEDKYNPLLDVTFDGVHILNNDIVSAKPRITIKLQDESKFLALTDPSLIKVGVVFPGSSDDNIYYYSVGDSLRFIPANIQSGENYATIELTPSFPIDGEYALIVSGKDVVGNKAGNVEYKVNFQVINKPMISDMLNYPNPFTTSTAFVFTLTGTEVPQGMRIQILTITGKVVKEISLAELGPIKIGRNITEYKWDGTDTYGQKLANGVYLYRVLTNLNGKSMDKYTGTNENGEVISEGVNKIGNYFNKGYGKMYLMR